MEGLRRTLERNRKLWALRRGGAGAGAEKHLER
jgi:hypothetical protein